MDIYIGFDSAWADNPKSPGAICAVGIEHGVPVQFHEPRLVSFDQALRFIRDVRTENGSTLVALDQPTVVPNLTGMRPVERVAAALVSWLGGGVQPSNRGKVGMFCNASPIWCFLTALGAVEDPERARTAADGLFLMEVFPALALASLGAGFFGRLSGPRYNPDRRKTFRMDDWVRVSEAAALEAAALGCEESPPFYKPWRKSESASGTTGNPTKTHRHPGGVPALGNFADVSSRETDQVESIPRSAKVESCRSAFPPLNHRRRSRSAGKTPVRSGRSS